MTAETFAAIVWLYIAVAVVVSIAVAQKLDRRLHERLPSSRRYRWGYYIGSMGLACVPFALLFTYALLVSAGDGQAERVGEFLVYGVYSAFQAICGWFIIKRRRWAWAFGTIFSLNIVLWIINGIYARNRW